MRRAFSCCGVERRAHLLLDNPIRSQQQRRRDGEAEGLGGLEVDDELEARGLVDR